jgi:hypothetical protein
MKQSYVSICLAVVAAMFGATSVAQAGVCGRGPWVDLPPTMNYRWGPESVCKCSSGQRGGAMLYQEPWSSFSLIWSLGGSNGGVGVEKESIKDGQRIFIPLQDRSVTSQKVLSAPSGSGAEVPWSIPNWALNYANPTGRYRSVCITNYSGFISSHTPAPSSPWQYD